MSYQGYLNNIKAKTGQSAVDFRRLAEEKGFTANGKLNPEIKAADVIK